VHLVDDGVLLAAECTPDAPVSEGIHHHGGRKPGLAAATARNVWGDVGRAFDEACNSKDHSLRVLTVDPTHGVRGPERGDEREKPFLYPAELLALLACELVPLHWRRMYAVAAYTGARANELAALLAEDVDLEHMKVHITKQRDRESAGRDRRRRVACGRSTSSRPSCLCSSSSCAKRGRGAS
jgi:integrase